MASQPNPTPPSERAMAWGFWLLYHSVYVFLAHWVWNNTDLQLNLGVVWKITGGVSAGVLLGFMGWRRFRTRRNKTTDFLNEYTEVLNLTFLLLTWFMFLVLLSWPVLPFLGLFWLIHTSLAPSSSLTQSLLHYRKELLAQSSQTSPKN